MSHKSDLNYFVLNYCYFIKNRGSRVITTVDLTEDNVVKNAFYFIHSIFKGYDSSYLTFEHFSLSNSCILFYDCKFQSFANFFSQGKKRFILNLCTYQKLLGPDCTVTQNIYSDQEINYTPKITNFDYCIGTEQFTMSNSFTQSQELRETESFTYSIPLNI